MSREDGSTSMGESGDELVTDVYEWRTDEPATAVVESVTEAADADQTELPPAYEYFEPEALNRMFEVSDESVTRTVERVRLRYAGFPVEVRRDGRVVVEPRR